MTRLGQAEIVELCQAQNIDPSIVIAVDVSEADVVLVLRVPLAGLTDLEREADAQAARNDRRVPPYVPEV